MAKSMKWSGLYLLPLIGAILNTPDAAAASFGVLVPEVPSAALLPGESILLVGTDTSELSFAEAVARESNNPRLGSSTGSVIQGTVLPSFDAVPHSSNSKEPAALAHLAQEQGASLAGVGRITLLEPSEGHYEKEIVIREETDKGEVKRTVVVDCITQRYDYRYDWLLVRSSGEILAQDSINYERWSGTKCSDEPGVEAVMPPKELPSQSRLEESRADDFVRLWRPYFLGKSLQLPPGISLTSKDVADPEKAVLVLLERIEANHFDHHSVVHAALVLGLAGHMDSASVLLAQAERLRGEDLSGLEAQLVELNGVHEAYRERYPTDWTAPGLSAEPELMERANSLLQTSIPSGNPQQLKATRKQSIEMLDSPERKAGVVVELPVGLAVYTTEESKRWTRAVTPDGLQEGWILTWNLKTTQTEKLQ